MLVIPESEYSWRVPIMIGTIHINEITDLITDEELKTASCQWQCRIISCKVVVKEMQLKENKDILDQVKGGSQTHSKSSNPTIRYHQCFWFNQY